jgi:hypothetical protein
MRGRDAPTVATAAAAAVPARLREQQFELTRHLRDPDTQPAPEGIEERRLKIYRELLFNNIASLLAGNFPVIHKLLGDEDWRRWVRRFYRDHRCQTPLFPEIAREFVRFLEGLPALDPPFLAELAHYEWVELALQIFEADVGDVDYDATGDLLAHPPVVSPLAWPLAYRWPVHRIGPDHRPDTPPDLPTLLMLRREPDGHVRFSELSPLAFRLIEQLSGARLSEQRLSGQHQTSGRDHLLALAAEAGVDDTTAFVEQGHALLRQMHATGVVLGTAP